MQRLGAREHDHEVEQAGLVIANAHQGTLPDGWVEYFDKETNRCYYYNVHTKTTTWYKPRKDKPPPPPPPGAPPGAATRRQSSGGSSASTTPREHTGTNMVSAARPSVGGPLPPRHLRLSP